MASKTTNYGLNKHSPQDFYNVEARNENWDKIDEALAATDPTKITAKAEPADGDGVMIADSADGGKAKRLLWSNVKAALGKLFVPLARKINGKALSADVTLTGDDIAMGADDAESLRAAMAKRLWRYTQMWNTVDVPTTVDAVNQLEPGCYGFVLTKCMDWMPPDLGDFLARYELIVHNVADKNQNGTVRLRCIDGAYNLMEYIGEILIKSEGLSIRWRRVVTCMPPEVHELPLASGFPAQSYANTYCKTQEGIVHLNFCIFRGESTAFVERETICTMPEGYRPSIVIAVAVGGDGKTFGNGLPSAELHIEPDGRMCFYGADTRINWVYGEITYLAG